jgi:hypothetical protein
VPPAEHLLIRTLLALLLLLLLLGVRMVVVGMGEPCCCWGHPRMEIARVVVVRMVCGFVHERGVHRQASHLLLVPAAGVPCKIQRALLLLLLVLCLLLVVLLLRRTGLLPLPPLLLLLLRCAAGRRCPGRRPCSASGSRSHR